MIELSIRFSPAGRPSHNSIVHVVGLFYIEIHNLVAVDLLLHAIKFWDNEINEWNKTDRRH